MKEAVPRSAAPRSIDEITRCLRQTVSALQKKRVIAGFDGFVDTIVKPVRRLTESGAYEFFETIDEFGGFIAEHSHKSTSIQYKVVEKKPGGNMPNFVKALAAFSLASTAVGMLSTESGVPDPLFGELGESRRSYFAAGAATVMEFADGKIFLSPITIPGLKAGEPVFPLIEGVFPEFKEAAARADLLAFLNWSELPFSHNLWDDIYTHCLDSAPADKTRIAFFDLCETAAKNLLEIEVLAATIKKIGGKRKTILSLNGNEAQDVSGKIRGETFPATESAEFLCRYFELDELVVHRHTGSAAVSSGGISAEAPCALNKAPKISTGAGDHFNAAYCLASMAELPLAEKLIFANSCAGAYVAKGFSPRLD